MPKISKWGWGYDLTINVEVEEFMSECDDGEIEEIIKYLKETDEINQVIYYLGGGVLDAEWNEIISHLSQNRHRLSLEEENTIKSIYLKYS